MSFFHHVSFPAIDPLGDGLGDEIEAERHEPEAIVLEEQLDGSLASQWDTILKDVETDPDWFKFAEDE